jgi:hypothetical protein
MSQKDRDNRNEQNDSQKESNRRDQSQQQGERSGRFQDHVEKLERPGEWPNPPTEKE